MDYFCQRLAYCIKGWLWAGWFSNAALSRWSIREKYGKKIFIFHVPRSSSADCTHRLCSQSTFTELLVWWWYFYVKLNSVLSLYSTVSQQVVFISPSAAHLFNTWLLCRIIPKNSHSHHSVKSFYWNVNKSYGDFWRGVTVWELCEKVPVKQSH